MKNVEKTRKRVRAGQFLLATLLAAALCFACFTAPIAAVRREGESFTLVWMSDTQHYSGSYPKTFRTMSDWIVENREKRGIQYVIHTGDVVHTRKKAAQWTNAQHATAELVQGVPFFLVAGNHDTGTDSPNFGEFSRLFGPKPFENLPSLGGFYGEGVGRYDLFSAGGRDFIIAGLSYGHNKQAVFWLNDVLAQHQDRIAILAFHSYLDVNGKLTSHGKKLFAEVVEKNPNVHLVLCGHKHGVNRRVSDIDDDGDGKTDRQVYQLLCNYQGAKQGGQGYMCLLKFDFGEGKIDVRSYSPLLNMYKGGEKENFTIPIGF